jgi:stage III sporulation protein AG
MKDAWEEIKAKFFPPRKDQLLILILVGLLLVVIALPSGEKSSAAVSEESLEISSAYTSELEQKLKEHLELVEGVGQVQVMLTIDNTDTEGQQVKGVLVIAQGGGDSRIQKEIMEAAQALFGIEAHKIKIMKMEENR